MADPVPEIVDHGPLVISTNYWQLPPRPGELLHVSVNAGAFRVLLRRAAESCIPWLKPRSEG